jgi:hypothetical protein
MQTYRIEMMAKGDYHEYMVGGYNYRVHRVDIEANTAEEAVEVAKSNNPEMVINTDYIRTVAELEEMEAKRKAESEAYWKAEEERKAKAKAHKEEREKAKAEALGLTVEEYKAKKSQEKKANNLREKIAELEKELARAKRALAKLEEGA